MRTSNRYTLTRSAVVVNATAEVRVHEGSNHVEIKIIGRIDRDRQFRIICDRIEAEEIAIQIMRAVSKIRRASV